MIRRTAAVGFATLVALVLGAVPALAAESESSGGDTTLIVISAAAAAGALFLLIVVLFGPNSAVERDLRGRLGSYAVTDAERKGVLSRIPLLRRFVSQAESIAEERGLLTSIERALAQANLPLRAGEAIAAAIATAILVGALSWAFTQNAVWGLIGAGISVLAAAAAVQSIANRDHSRFEKQLPDTLNLISTSLRAGYSLLQAVEAVAQEAPEPTAREFSRAVTETRLGRSPTDTLNDVADRMQSTDFEWAVLAIGIQRDVGGNLAEVLQTAAETMVQRNRLRREMKALSAEGRISAMVLGALPFGLFLFMWTTNRSYIQPLLDSTGGIIAIIGALGLLLAGIYWLTRIVKVEI